MSGLRCRATAIFCGHADIFRDLPVGCALLLTKPAGQLSDTGTVDVSAGSDGSNLLCTDPINQGVFEADTQPNLGLPPPPIPALSWWGLILVVLLLSASFVYQRITWSMK